METIQEKTAAKESVELEIVRGDYFYRDDLPYLTLYNDMLSFNNRCVSLLSDPKYVNIIVAKDHKTIHIRGSKSTDFNAVRWYNIKKGVKRSRKIRSKMMTAKLFDKVGFDYGHKYRLSGEYRDDDVPELVFYVDEAQVYVLKEENGKKWFVQRFKEEWQDSYGIPVSENKGHKINTFEDYIVLDVTLERVEEMSKGEPDAETVERLKELKEKYIKGENR